MRVVVDPSDLLDLRYYPHNSLELRNVL